MNVVPFGRTPAERRRNAEAAAFEPDWRSKYPSRPEARRANLLAGSTCKVCERKFAHGTAVPADRVCRDCRYDMQQDPSLF